MARMAKRKNLPESLVVEEVYRGRSIIPANVNHASFEPIAISIASKQEVNAYIGISQDTSGADEGVNKLEIEVK